MGLVRQYWYLALGVDLACLHWSPFGVVEKQAQSHQHPQTFAFRRVVDSPFAPRTTMKQKQKRVTDFFHSDSPSPVKKRKPAAKTHVVISDDDDESDMDLITLEPSRKAQTKAKATGSAEVIEISDDSEDNAEDVSPRRQNTTTTRRVSRRQVRSQSPVASQTKTQASDDENMSPRQGKGPRIRLLPDSDDDDTPQTKRRRLRLRNESSEDLLEELDDDSAMTPFPYILPDSPALRDHRGTLEEAKALSVF